MLPGQQEVSKLLGLLYDAAAEPALWAPFVKDLARRTKATSAALVVQSYDQDLYSISNSWQVPESFVRAYQEHYHSLDIWAQVVVPKPSEYPSGSAYTSQSLCPHPQMKRTEFYNDHLVRGRIEHAMFALVENSESCVAAVALYRDKSCVEFHKSELKLLQFLAPHLQRAFGLHRRFSALKSRADSVETALDTLATGVIFLDSRGQIVHMNRSASALLAEKDGLIAASASLRAELSLESARLRGMIQEAVSTSNGKALSAGGMILVSRRTRPALPLQVSPIRNSSANPIQNIAAVVHVFDPLRQQRPSEALLRGAYGLTPAECRIALLLSDGHAPKAIAEMIGVSENTVRTQIKGVFSKTGVKRQVELVRLLLNARPGI